MRSFKPFDKIKDALANAIEAASIAFVYTRKEFDVGTKTTFDLLNTEQKLLDAQTQNRK